MHVLLIEPDRLLARVCKSALERNGHSVTHTQSAQTAVQLCDEHTPDVVVLELQLARHNGIEFLYEFRSYPEWQQVPVVVHSFVPPDQLKAVTLASELGVVATLYKPVTTMAQLCAVVQKVQPTAV